MSESTYFELMSLSLHFFVKWIKFSKILTFEYFIVNRWKFSMFFVRINALIYWAPRYILAMRTVEFLEEFLPLIPLLRILLSFLESDSESWAKVWGNFVEEAENTLGSCDIKCVQLCLCCYLLRLSNLIFCMCSEVRSISTKFTSNWVKHLVLKLAWR